MRLRLNPKTNSIQAIEKLDAARKLPSTGVPRAHPRGVIADGLHLVGPDERQTVDEALAVAEQLHRRAEERRKIA